MTITPRLIAHDHGIIRVENTVKCQSALAPVTISHSNGGKITIGG